MCLRKIIKNQFRLVLTLALGLVVASLPVNAADKAKKKASSEPKSAWIKICDEVKFKDVTKNAKKDGDKAEAKKRKICLTQHDSLNTYTGAPLISASVRTVTGDEKSRFMVSVPLGMVIPAGVLVKVDDEKPFTIKYSFCHQVGCVAEINMEAALFESLKKGKKLHVKVLAISGKPVVFPVSLNGFNKAHGGPSISSEKYGKALKSAALQIRKIRSDQAKKKRDEKIMNAGKKTEKKK